MEQETACLILNTFDISTSTNPTTFANNATVDNQFGTIANNRCTLTWKNINMRLVLGVMYDKYETFNMYLYQISQSQGFGGSTTCLTNQQLVDIRIKGLQFLNNGYNTTSRNNTSSAFLTSYVLNPVSNANASLGTVTPMFNPTIITFGKSVDCVDITIDMKNTYNQSYPTIALNQSFGSFVFMFKFYGIPTREPNIFTNGSRM